MVRVAHEAAEHTLRDDSTQPFVGRWNKLISTTNWEKGQIIQEWRAALRMADAPVSEYSDEVWSRRVGGVSAQHVGRLRRVFERFRDTRDSYDGLYWSHFQAALDWNDAEMWLEGAAQSGWSVAEMRRQRWEAVGAPAELKPNDADIIVSELDEDFDPLEPADERPNHRAAHESSSKDRLDAAGTEADGGFLTEVEPAEGESKESAGSRPRPFENLPSIPPDLDEAIEGCKLAILRHKMAKWESVSPDEVIDHLDALAKLVRSPIDP